jgi:hypothetical protein
MGSPTDGPVLLGEKWRLASRVRRGSVGPVTRSGDLATARSPPLGISGRYFGPIPYSTKCHSRGARRRAHRGSCRKTKPKGRRSGKGIPAMSSRAERTRGPGRWYARTVAADHLAGRRGKARDFASLASPASLIAPNYCQQMICVGDAKLETARGSRHGFCVRVTRSSRRIGRTLFPD